MTRQLRKQIGTNKPNWNMYDPHYEGNPEYLLVESVTAEYCDITGIKCTYYIRDNITTPPDILYGETQDITYKEGKQTRILYQVAEIETLYSMFGMMATDQIIAHIPQCVYIRDVSDEMLPKPGDVIKMEWYYSDFNNEINSGRTFEIMHVAQDQAIFQLRSLVYVLYLKPYRFSQEGEMSEEMSSDLSTTLPGISAFGDNVFIDEQVDQTAYIGIDKSIYGY